MTRLTVHAARLAFILASASLLSGCGYLDGEETIIPRPELLTAQEAGGGEQIPISGGDLSVAADCGPDGTIYYPEPEGTPYGVQYVTDGRRIILGAWDYLDGSFDFGPPEIDRLAHSDYCRMA